MAQPNRGHILTFKPKKSLKFSMHLGRKDINFGFGGGRGNKWILIQIYNRYSAIYFEINRKYYSLLNWPQFTGRDFNTYLVVTVETFIKRKTIIDIQL